MKKQDIFICSIILLLALACKKSTYQSVSSPINLNLQEQTLISKWALQKSETYEIFGIDTSGQLQCVLIGSSICDSLCTVEFKNQYYLGFNGSGSIGACNPLANFIWNAKQQNKIQVNDTVFYDIIYLTPDSFALANIYIKDILKLKSIVYYKKN